MPNGNAAECAAACDTPGFRMERRDLVSHMKSISWARAIVDALLLAGLLAASCSVLLQR